MQRTAFWFGNILYYNHWQLYFDSGMFDLSELIAIVSIKIEEKP